MNSFLTKIIGDKKEWKAMEAQADLLPRDYQIVYGEMKAYMWRFTSGNGMDTVAVLKQVLALFETNAAQGTTVLDVTGRTSLRSVTNACPPQGPMSTRGDPR